MRQRFFSTLPWLSLWPLLTGLAVVPQPEPLALTSSAHPQATARASDTREEWLGVYQEEEKVGYLHRHLTATATGYDWEEHWWLSLRLFDDTEITHTEVHAQADRNCALTAFSLWSVGAGAALYVNAQVVNQHSTRHTLKGESINNGEIVPFSLSLSMPLHLPSLCQMANPLGSRPGTTREFRVFNPVSLRAETVSLTTVGSEVIDLNGHPHLATRLTSDMNDSALSVWLDQNGQTLREEIAPGVTLRRESRETATVKNWQKTGFFLPLATADAEEE